MTLNGAGEAYSTNRPRHVSACPSTPPRTSDSTTRRIRAKAKRDRMQRDLGGQMSDEPQCPHCRLLDAISLHLTAMQAFRKQGGDDMLRRWPKKLFDAERELLDAAKAVYDQHVARPAHSH